MIWKLRKKFIWIATVSFLCVFLIILLCIYAFSIIHTNGELDKLADIISEHGGTFPDFFPDKSQDKQNDEPDRNLKPNTELPPNIDRESKFTTRYFSVRLDENGKITDTDLGAVASITALDAENYTYRVLNGGKNRGWIDNYRYKSYDVEEGELIVFVDGRMQRNSFENFLYIAVFVFLAGSLISLLIIILVSKKAVKPVAESYEKQKQFITDAGHELKTPLTLILTDLDIAESELGENEWLNDIRASGNQMSELVKQLISLAKTDEEKGEIQKESFSLTDTSSECVSYFEGLAEQKSVTMTNDVESGVVYKGNETMIRQVIYILLDNALKYCDENGRVSFSLKNKKHPVLTVDNSFSAVEEVEFERLFDRFYRADKARTSGEGFGIGLSIAKSIVEKHGGSISAHNAGNKTIRFVVKL